MKALSLTVSAVIITLLLSTTAYAGIPLTSFKGKWINENANTNNITKINFDLRYKLYVRVWGKCHPKDCDWGQTVGIPYGGSQNTKSVKVTYYKSFKVTNITIVPLSKTRIKVISYTKFKDKSGRKPFKKIEYFKKQFIVKPTIPGGTVYVPRPIKEDCVKFNYKNLKVIKKYGKYIVVDGNHSVFSAPNKREAYQIIKICKYYKLNRSCFVGRPYPSFTYLLRGTSAPSGAMAGEDVIGFNPSNLKVVPYGNSGKYRLLDGNHALFLFPNKSEAYLALNIIKKYGFKKSCFVGRPNSSLQYMRK